MPPANSVRSVVGTALTASSCSTASLTRIGGRRAWIYVGIVYNSAFVDTPVQTVVHGSDSGSFLTAVTSFAEVSLEIWAIALTSQTTAATVDVNFGAGPSLSINVIAIEVANIGVVAEPSSATTTAFGQSSGPITASITSTTISGGRKGTISVPVTDNLLLGFGCLKDATSTMTISSGTVITSTNVGAAAARIVSAAAYVQATGGSNTISWTISAGTPRWAEGIVDIGGAALEMFPIKTESMPPTVI